MNAQWLDPVDLRVVDDAGPRPRFELLAPATFYSAVLEREVTVPVGFVFDGASIPQIALSLTGWPALRAALLHDWCCTSRCVDRSVGDRLFLEAMRVSGVDEGTALAMYAAVSAYTQITTGTVDPVEPGSG